MFYDGLFDRTCDGDSGDCDEIMATGMANARERVHLWRSVVNSSSMDGAERVLITRVNANRSPTASVGELGFPSSGQDVVFLDFEPLFGYVVRQNLVRVSCA